MTYDPYNPKRKLQRKSYPRQKGRVTEMVKEMLSQGYDSVQISEELGVEPKNVMRIWRRIKSAI